MGEVATWSMIRSKISSFPAPTSGRGNECLTKSEIISMGGNGVEVSGSYGNQETVVLDNIGAVTWEYTLSVSVSSLSFAGTGETKSFTVTSTKQKKVNGVNSGSPVSVGYSNSISGTGFSISGNSVTAKNNASSSSRSGTITVTQGESGKKVTVSLSQDAGTISNEIKLTFNSSGQITARCQYAVASTLTISGVLIADTPKGNNQILNYSFSIYSGALSASGYVNGIITSIMSSNATPYSDSKYTYNVTH